MSGRDTLDSRRQTAGQFAHAFTAAAPDVFAGHHGSHLIRKARQDLLPGHPGPNADVRLAQRRVSDRLHANLVTDNAGGIPGALEIAAVNRPERVGLQTLGDDARLLAAAI